MVGAGVGAILGGAVSTAVTNKAAAGAIEAAAMLRAVIGAVALRAVSALPAILALAGAVDALATQRAVIGAKLGLTAVAGPARIAHARAIHAGATVVALVGAHWLLTAVAHPALGALTAAIGLAHAMTGALVGAPLDVATRTHVLASLANALSVLAVTVDAVLANAAAIIGSLSGVQRHGCGPSINRVDDAVLSIGGVDGTLEGWGGLHGLVVNVLLVHFLSGHVSISGWVHRAVLALESGVADTDALIAVTLV